MTGVQNRVGTKCSCADTAGVELFSVGQLISVSKIHFEKLSEPCFIVYQQTFVPSSSLLVFFYLSVAIALSFGVNALIVHESGYYVALLEVSILTKAPVGPFGFSKVISPSLGSTILRTAEQP
jgi:hypothetical protein